MVARAGHDVWDRLPSIACPTLVASGRYDEIAPVSNGRAIASRIPMRSSAEYEGGHAFLLQDPAGDGTTRSAFLGDTAPACPMIRYFAYGSNMDPGQMAERCPSARLLRRPGSIDFRLAFTRESEVTYPGSGVADVLAAPGSVVWGAVYAVDDATSEPSIGSRGLALHTPENRSMSLTRGRRRCGRDCTRSSAGPIANSWPTAEYISRVIGGARACGLGRDYAELLESTCGKHSRAVRASAAPSRLD